VQGGYHIGGLVGANSATITRSYSTGTVAGTFGVGGFVGAGAAGTYSANYWNTQTSGTADGVADLSPDPSDVTGLTTQQMTSQSNFAGWDFDANGQGAGNDGVWIMAGRPHLQMEHNFIKTVGGAKRITNAVELQMMALDLAVDYILGNDIDASETSSWNWDGTTYDGFRPIGHDTNNTFVSNELEGVHFDGNAFMGQLDGDGHKVSGLYIDRPDEDFIGLFGKVQDDDLTEQNWQAHRAAILDFVLENPRVSGRRFVGGLAGLSDAKIQSSSVVATQYTKNTTSAYVHGGGTLSDIFGSPRNVGFAIGGMVGKAGTNDASLSVIADSSTRVVVQHNTGSQLLNVGGLAGQANDAAKVVNSKAEGDVIAPIVLSAFVFNETNDFGQIVSRVYDMNHHIGGLIGEHDGLARGDLVGGQQLYVEATGTVEGYHQVGGLVGAVDGTLSFGRATGGNSVLGEDQVGGLVGRVDDDPGASVTRSYASRTVGSGSNFVDEKAGGLVGKNAGGTITWSYANSTVYGSRHAGGFIGENEGGTIADSYAIVNLTVFNLAGDEESGGFVGQGQGGTITRCYASGTISGSGSRVGGFVGDNNDGSSITNSFANVTTLSGANGFFGRQNAFTSGCYSTVADTSATLTTLAALTATAGGVYTHAVYATWDFDVTAPSWLVNVGLLPTHR